MHLRRPVVVGQCCLTMALIVAIYFHYGRLPTVSRLTTIKTSRPATSPPSITPLDTTQPAVTSADDSPLQISPPEDLNIKYWVDAILDTHSPGQNKFDCLDPDLSRYIHLKVASSPARTKYFFALNIEQNLEVLPRLLGSAVEAIRFLGPENCALSIVGGNSDDGTDAVLTALKPHLDKKTRVHLLLSSTITAITMPETSRFVKLAELRNLALKPMLKEPERYGNSTVVFLNDVAICPDDILELVHQRVILGADMTCAMDWIDSKPAIFHDIYTSRAINGDTFFETSLDGNWEREGELFWNEPESKERFDTKEPFQVFACWNGAVAFTAEPIVKKEVAFRGPRIEAGECIKGETELLSKDLWYRGYGKIAVVPSVNLEYSNRAGQLVKLDKGYVSELIKPASEQRLIRWKPPPEKVKCMPDRGHQSWVSWDEMLGDILKEERGLNV